MLRNSHQRSTSVRGMSSTSVLCATISLMRSDTRVSRKTREFGLGDLRSKLVLYLLTLGVVALMSLGCGTAHATLQFFAPSTTTAATPFTVTVMVLYQGKPDLVINSHIHFTSSDPVAVLPPDYYFTAADAGSHTWNNGFVLMTPGIQTISADIFDATGINGRATISVSP